LGRAYYVLVSKDPEEGRNRTLDNGDREELDKMTHADMLAELDVSLAAVSFARASAPPHALHLQVGVSTLHHLLSYQAGRY